MKRTNIILTDEQHGKLTSYARENRKTLGELVREALDTTYMKKDLIEHRRMVSIEAYKEGFISLGKLSEILGIDVVSLRVYLKDHGISINMQESSEIMQDMLNA
ncbi:MAG: UPF0175 family protein [Proteobacteria bacterium]|nr:UPF0175 family protein [Pseudomonadota bacterium]